MLSGRRAASLLRRAVTPTPARLHVAPAESSHRRAVEAVVASAPVTHAHVGAYFNEALRHGAGLWVLLDGALVVGAIQRLRGVSWAIAPEVAESAATVAALADFVARWSAVQEIVFGPQAQLQRVLSDAAPRGLATMELRQQVMLRCDTPLLPALDSQSVTLRAAEPRDLAWLLRAHAAMCREDLGVDQVARNPEGYRRHFHELIQRNLCFVGESNGRPVFKAEAPVVSDQAWMFEGVYTETASRGRGIATRAMAELTIQAAGRGFVPCLYVHRRNTGALHVYNRIGYREVTPWTTALVSRDAPSPGGPLMW